MALTQVQRTTAAANASTITATYPSTPGQNHLLVVAVTSDATGSITSSGWTQVTSAVNFVGLYMYYKIAGASEPTTVVFTPASAVATGMVIWEFSGNLTSGVLDVFASDNTGTFNFTTPTGTTAATAQADELALCVVGRTGDANVATSWTNSFVIEASAVQGTVTCSTASKALAATGAQSSVATFATALNGTCGIMATFKAAAAGGASVTAPPLAGVGDIPNPTIAASSNVTSPPELGLGAFPASSMAVSTDVTSGPMSGTGAFPVPAVSGNAGDATVTSPVADGTGALPVPTVAASSGVTAPPMAGTGTSPVPGVTPPPGGGGGGSSLLVGCRSMQGIGV